MVLYQIGRGVSLTHLRFLHWIVSLIRIFLKKLNNVVLVVGQSGQSAKAWARSATLLSWWLILIIFCNFSVHCLSPLLFVCRQSVKKCQSRPDDVLLLSHSLSTHTKKKSFVGGELVSPSFSVMWWDVPAFTHTDTEKKQKNFLNEKKWKKENRRRCVWDCFL